MTAAQRDVVGLVSLKRSVRACMRAPIQEDEWLLQSVWEAMGIHNEKYQHLGQGIFGAMAAGLVIFCLISVVSASARRKPKRNRR
jgi:hypothetical protein